ncbi:hypothetical protein ACFRJ9_19785 [Paenarthrobacter sp. NPDC056912]|uniref:hypothetical protein n=1 Tax=Paenarthrobacter sp. NPDC056912 TaxID=3345965 RepID=UPI00366ABD45
METSLIAAWAIAQKNGWAWGTGHIGVLRLEATQAGWVEVETRKGEGVTSVLRPTTRAAAWPRSISAAYGLDEQPLHVDGSHMPEPPDAVLLVSKKQNDTPTNLRRLKSPDGKTPWEVLRHGTFVVGSGPWAFLAPVLEDDKIRYDPNVMEPADARAREAAAYMASLQESSEPFEWEKPDTFLLIANRSVLHGRAKVEAGDEDREVLRVAFRVGEEN